MGRCRRHPSHLVVGICAHCLHHRLLSLRKQEQQAEEESSSSASPVPKSAAATGVYYEEEEDDDEEEQFTSASAARFSCSGPIAAAAAVAMMHQQRQSETGVDVSSSTFNHHHQQQQLRLQHRHQLKQHCPPYPAAATISLAASASPAGRYFSASTTPSCFTYSNHPGPPPQPRISFPTSIAPSAPAMNPTKPLSSSSSLWRRFLRFYGLNHQHSGSPHPLCTCSPFCRLNHPHPRHRCCISNSSPCSRRVAGDGHVDIIAPSASPLFQISSPQLIHEARHRSPMMPAAGSWKRSSVEDYRTNRGTNCVAMAEGDDAYGHDDCGNHHGICYRSKSSTWRIRSILSRLMSRRQRGDALSAPSPPPPLLQEVARISFSERLAPPPAVSPCFCSSPVNIVGMGMDAVQVRSRARVSDAQGAAMAEKGMTAGVSPFRRTIAAAMDGRRGDSVALSAQVHGHHHHNQGRHRNKWLHRHAHSQQLQQHHRSSSRDRQCEHRCKPKRSIP